MCVNSVDKCVKFEYVVGFSLHVASFPLHFAVYKSGGRREYDLCRQVAKSGICVGADCAVSAVRNGVFDVRQ